MAVFDSHWQKENAYISYRRVVDPPALNRDFTSISGLFPVFLSQGETIFPYNGRVARRISHDFSLTRMEEESSISLRQFIINEELLPSSEEEEKRRIIIQKLKKIVVRWVKKVAWQRRLPKHQIATTHATVLTFGSYGLRVHGPHSDLDVLCVGPFFATIAEDFFIGLRNMLKSRPEITGIHCVKDAKVPLMRFKFDGISVDLPYARLQVLSVPDNVDVLNPLFLRNIDDTSRKSLSGVHVNICIWQLVPDLELNGYLGGVHLAILAAFICQNHPNANLCSLICIFFDTYAHWSWPLPVALEDGTLPLAFPADRRSLMPIRLPSSPHEYCHSNVTWSTFYRIRTEFLRAHSITRGVFRPGFNWQKLFERFQHAKNYTRFIKLYISAFSQDELGKWVGWVKSRFPRLLVKLEEAYDFCDPDPTEYVDSNSKLPNVVFYWGVRSRLPDIGFIEMEFSKNIDQGYRERPQGTMQISIIQASQFPKATCDSQDKKLKACWRIREGRRPQAPTHSFDGRSETERDMTAIVDTSQTFGR